MVGRNTLLALVVAAPLLVPAPTRAQSDNPWLDRRFLNIAHRGGRFEAPEHTMYAYAMALRSRATVLEIDVHRSADGVLVVSHDATVDRVTNGTGPVASMTLAQLKTLDAAYWFSSACEGNCTGQPPENYDFRGVATGDVSPPDGFEAADFQMPTMREVLEAYPDILMSIEIKGSVPDSVPVAEDLADLLIEFGRTSDVMIASFDSATTAAFKARAPDVHTTPAQDEILAFVLDPGPLPHKAFQVPRTFQSLPVALVLIPPATANDLPVYFFLDRDEETPAVYHELIDAGAAGIITDRPSALQAVLDERRAAYFYPQPLPTRNALIKKATPLVRFVGKAPLEFPRFPPNDLPASLLVEHGGGELFDPLTAGDWTPVGRGDSPRGYRYVNRSAPVGGACRLVVVKPGGVKAICRDTGTIPPPSGAGADGDVRMQLNLGIDRYCLAGIAPHAREKAGRLIKVKKTPAPASCSRPAPTGDGA